MQASWTGKVLGGRYRVGELLGVGGVGAVYAGIQQDLGRQVAIKVLRPGIEEVESQVLARLEREAKAAGSLAHPNIVQVTDFQNNPGEPAFLVMDLLQGRSLATMLEQDGAVSEARAAFIAYQVLDGLEAAHGAGILHRDLKPDNIFLISVAGIPDIVKILDFGIAKLLHASGQQDKITQTGDAPGTPAFMSPEQLYSETVDVRTDIYSLGVVIYCMLTGQLPFDAPSFAALVLSVVDHHYTPAGELRPDLDPAMAALVDRAMARDPSDRFSGAREMKEVLAPWIPAVTPGAVQPATGPLEALDTVEMIEEQDLPPGEGNGDLDLLRGAATALCQPEPALLRRSAEAVPTGAGAAKDGGGRGGTTLSLSAGQNAALRRRESSRSRLAAVALSIVLLVMAGAIISHHLLASSADEEDVRVGAEAGAPGASGQIQGEPRLAGPSRGADRPKAPGAAAGPTTPPPEESPEASLATENPQASQTPDSGGAQPDMSRPPQKGKPRKQPIKPGGLRIGLLSAQGKPIVAPVFVDGVKQGLTPALLRGLSPGRHRVELRPPGLSPIRRVIRIRPGRITALPVKVGGANE